MFRGHQDMQIHFILKLIIYHFFHWCFSKQCGVTCLPLVGPPVALLNAIGVFFEIRKTNTTLQPIAFIDLSLLFIST